MAARDPEQLRVTPPGDLCLRNPFLAGVVVGPSSEKQRTTAPFFPWTLGGIPETSSILHQRGCQEEGLDEVTVLVASMEAINTHKVVLQHLSPWQPRLPSSVDSESSAQGGGYQCICVWLRVHVCPRGCCERSHQCTGEGGGTQGGDPGTVSAAALAPVAPSLPCFSPF